MVTSRDAILKTCRQLVSENGFNGLTMRSVALACNVALGSLYNYFPSKNDLTIATIESVWQDIFHMERPCEPCCSFLDYVQQIFERVSAGITAYPNCFTAHSIGVAGSDKTQARQTMEHYFTHMRGGLLTALQQDKKVREDAFSKTFTPEELADFVLSALLSQLMQQKASCQLLLEILHRTLY
ncbi:MAG: TetR/AcrR family transcriptional regulator [Oscillospiraceae bacterium]